ncbi:TPM domain-containing protein, partial [Candidatus Woesearchaeota archaeon]|nr:TPM domain-containing protein [Candidatus Woesearchaeota archaeon]
MDFKKGLTLVLLISMVLITGCININVEQKLKRNGHYDLDLTISTSPEYKILLNGIKEDLQVDDSVRDRFEYRETETSITYSFKDIDPSTHRLFKEVEKKPGEDNVFGQSQQTPDFSFINPENIEFKKEFKFPYYEFTYKLKVTPPSEEELKKPETLSVNEYILDEAGVLDQELKNEIMQSINNVYKNDSVEIIIVTKKQMSAMDYFSYKLDFINSFDFKNKNKQYVLVFASTNENGICRVESNIFDSKASSKVRSLNRDFSKNCKTDYSSQIKNVVLQLDKFFQSHDLTSSKQVEEQIKQLFKISYT